MEKLVTVKDVSERYRCSLPTARKYIRECNPHMEHPLATTEFAFREWEKGRTVWKKMSASEFNQLSRKLREGNVIVPRRR